MRPVGNALELKLCKIPTIGTQSENQTLPTGNISLGSPIVFSGWALHQPNASNQSSAKPSQHPYSRTWQQPF
ncbi:hypothetical protein [Helicobacter pylori]|uniref:hypothetical protein n=1 Tax=Helicobacter pylori TaxID=210 RepID=UPI00111B34C9